MDNRPNSIEHFHATIDKYIDLVGQCDRLLQKALDQLQSDPELLSLYTNASYPDVCPPSITSGGS